jgi:hypothetical protein
MISIPFQQQFTWRKLGYLFYTNSLDYRAVLTENPQWKVTELPPIGAQLHLPNPSSSTSSLQQSTFLYGNANDETLDIVFPFNTQAEYTAALDRYTVQGVVLRESVNGYSADSETAFTGVQNG